MSNLKTVILKFLNTLVRGKRTMAEQCHFCQNEIGPEFRTEYYRLNSLIYCSVQCYGDEKNSNKESNIKISNGSQANQSRKRSKKVQPKRKEQKKGQRK